MQMIIKRESLEYFKTIKPDFKLDYNDIYRSVICVKISPIFAITDNLT